MYASRNTVLRHVAGGSSSGLNGLRKARQKARNNRQLKEFWAAVRRAIVGVNRDRERHVHPRGKREEGVNS